MRLSNFIEQNQPKIVAEWVKFAGTLLPWAKDITHKGLKDHAEALLSAVVTDMKEPQSKSEKAVKSKGKAAPGALAEVGKRHASERLATGLNLDQLVSEYRALRASVLRLWEESEGEKGGEVTRFNEAIDETLTESTAGYSKTVDNTRDQFLAILGHDLRSPLSAIMLGASQLTKSDNLDDREARVASRILNSSQRMSRMVCDLLDLTRTRLGTGIPVAPKAMDLKELCQQVILEFEGRFPHREVKLESHGDLKGEWDSDRLAQLLSNLVANALQYGDEETVSLSAEGRGDEVTLKVRNGGPPIPESVLKKIFDPMVRQPATSKADQNISGLGLGLFIANEIVLAHGGTIEVSSKEKEGTTFTVALPRRQAWSSRPILGLPGSASAEASRPQPQEHRSDRP